MRVFTRVKTQLGLSPKFPKYVMVLGLTYFSNLYIKRNREFSDLRILNKFSNNADDFLKLFI